ncbi:hypothetical protein [Suipraeoptans intestinalis]|uniref:hypothetical protein n=1 Tax=Suipraeoptans intestinalis TaxID=2606628 RepID=UPI0023F31933|nr:hypothetical protein [Suipraeoptans intestinalis]
MQQTTFKRRILFGLCALFMLLIFKQEALAEDRMTELRIPVAMMDGSANPANLRFIRWDTKYQVGLKMYANNGVLKWKPDEFSAGDYEIYMDPSYAFFSSPGMVRVHVEVEDGTPSITLINGQPASESGVRFLVSKKGTTASDLLHFRALVKDKEGNPLPGIKFRVKNGDPDVLVSDQQGILTYPVTSWDVDTTMTVELLEGQNWIAATTAVFSVSADPYDENQGILSSVNHDSAFVGKEVILTLSRPEDIVPKGWIKKDGIWYFYRDGNVLSTGWLKDGEHWYYLNPANGQMMTGWVGVGGQWYFMDKETGAMKTGWIKDGSTWYYLSGSGAMHIGWLNQGGAWYYLNQGGGQMMTGWISVGGQWYFMDRETGVMKTGWIKDGSTWYYLSGSGAMHTGWLNQGGVWYYLQGSGAMAEQTVLSVGGIRYRFGANGVWIG